MVRRLVGIDLGIASVHTVRVLDENGTTSTKRKAVPTVESLTGIEAAALVGCPERTRLEVVMEPTGPAWMPVAVFLARPGHVVSLTEHSFGAGRSASSFGHSGLAGATLGFHDPVTGDSLAVAWSRVIDPTESVNVRRPRAVDHLLAR